ncbi:response regulator [Rufibacter roseus]|uniref:Response regulator n=1 Tax=Rufibacter roseus TaxID=1567108 RepID=A0ABW2DK57_9BACT|nr:response regulator [Rufibacter roseus]
MTDNRSINKSIVILIADDDAEDRMLLKEALEENKLPNTVNFVENGEELMDYLLHNGRFADKEKYPLPGLILLDLNMPKKDGREALKEIKENDNLKHLPVVVLTTSKAEEDILKTYDLGVSSFITKPVTFASLVEMMRTLADYWLELVELPNNNNNNIK